MAENEFLISKAGLGIENEDKSTLILRGSVHPLTDGVDAPIGSMYILDDPANRVTIFLKFGEGINDWALTEAKELEYIIKTADFTAERNYYYILDTTNNEIIVTFPADPVVYDQFIVKPYKDTYANNPVTFTYNGVDRIQGFETDFVLDTNSRVLRFMYLDADRGWSIYDEGKFGDQIANEVMLPKYNVLNNNFDAKPNSRNFVDTSEQAIKAILPEQVEDGMFVEFNFTGYEGGINPFPLEIIPPTGVTLVGLSLPYFVNETSRAVTVVYEDANRNWSVMEIGDAAALAESSLPNVMMVRDSTGNQRFDARGPVVWDTEDIIDGFYQLDGSEITILEDGVYRFESMLGVELLGSENTAFDEAGGAFEDPDPESAAATAVSNPLSGLTSGLTGTLTGDYAFYYAIVFIRLEVLRDGEVDWVDIPGTEAYHSLPIQDLWTMQILTSTIVELGINDKIRLTCNYDVSAAGDPPYDFAIIQKAGSYISGEWIR